MEAAFHNLVFVLLYSSHLQHQTTYLLYARRR
jgi:hypothetical protein